MKCKKTLVIGLLLLSVILAACSTAASTEPASNFPAGKFVKTNAQNHGVIFNKMEPSLSLTVA
jgi:Spy/CpxP family protein refolding chaperone